jgi:histidyl-tRNA synthetase
LARPSYEIVKPLQRLRSELELGSSIGFKGVVVHVGKSLKMSKEESTKEILRNAPKYEDYISSEAKSFLGDLVDHYQDRCNIQIDSTLVRGLDYYTGIVFEVISEDLGAQDAYMGGGRYDNLSVQLGGKPMVAIGFAIGLERILELMTVKAAPHTIKVALIITLEHQDEKTYKIAHQLREANSEIILDAFLSNARLKSQLKRANKLNCDFAVIIGDEESNMNQVIWKDLSEHGDQKLLGIEDLLAVYKTL